MLPRSLHRPRRKPGSGHAASDRTRLAKHSVDPACWAAIAALRLSRSCVLPDRVRAALRGRAAVSRDAAPFPQAAYAGEKLPRRAWEKHQRSPDVAHTASEDLHDE